MQLPLSTAGLDVVGLSRLFDKTTTSYKLVFFQGILNILARESSCKAAITISVRELVIEMVAVAWYPHTFFRLSFGVQDQLGSALSKLEFNASEQTIAHTKTQALLRQAIEEQYEALGLENLLRYVPQRLLTPFFEHSLAGKPDHVKNRLISKLAHESFTTENPALYCFDTESHNKIVLHPNWVEYLRTSLPILQGWVQHNWIVYLQARNPNTPAIANKTIPPLMRKPLETQKEYWQSVLRATTYRCPYSGEVLTADRFSLDHFIPWTYVCHDQLWNLIPVLPEANSSKGNKLPSDIYLDRFIDAQCMGLQITSSIFKSKDWLKHTECYAGDLNLPPERLLVPEKVSETYKATLPAIMALAARSGFVSGWQYKKEA